MNPFAQLIGQSAAANLDDAQDLFEDSCHATTVARGACAKGYAEQHALNLKRRAERHAAREGTATPRSHALVTVRPARRAS